MQRRGLCGTLEGPPHRLAVNRKNPLATLGKSLHEADEPSLETGWIDQPEDAVERVVARNAVGQGQEFLKKIPFRPAKQGHVGAPRHTENRAPGNHQDLMQRMALGVARPRVLKLLENLFPILHGAPPLESAPFGRILPPPLWQRFFSNAIPLGFWCRVNTHQYCYTVCAESTSDPPLF